MIPHVITPGIQLGRLTVLRVIHPSLLPVTVKLSYRMQGTIYECLCECGDKAYYPEKFLSHGKVKSCGCLRREILLNKNVKFKVKLEVESIRQEIKRLHTTMDKLKLSGQLEKHQEEIGEKLRSLFARLKVLGLSR